RQTISPRLLPRCAFFPNPSDPEITGCRPDALASLSRRKIPGTYRPATARLRPGPQSWNAMNFRSREYPCCEWTDLVGVELQLSFSPVLLRLGHGWVWKTIEVSLPCLFEIEHGECQPTGGLSRGKGL